jgi:hypothetical protein
VEAGKCPAQGCEEVRTPKEVRPNTVLVHQQRNKNHAKESLLDCRTRICGPIVDRPEQEQEEETYAEREDLVDMIRTLLNALVQKQGYDRKRLGYEEEEEVGETQQSGGFLHNPAPDEDEEEEEEEQELPEKENEEESISDSE